MALRTGARIGPYEITAPLGAGGMGEVYRALDPKLNRDAALKVLPEAAVSVCKTAMGAGGAAPRDATTGRFAASGRMPKEIRP